MSASRSVVRRRRAIPPAAVLVLIAASASVVQSQRAAGAAAAAVTARVDAVFADLPADAPGCAVGVYRNGDPLLVKGYGLASVEDARPMTGRTTFNLGSAAKAFTALAVLRLEEQRRLSLDDEVRRYVPELPDYGTPIRIRDLLQHTSGLRDYGTLDLLAGEPTRTMPEFVALMARQQRLNFTPGTKHEYSHSDFVLAGLIVERIVREPFGGYLEREVLRPLAMTGSRVHDARGASVPARAYGHEKTETGFRVLFPDSSIIGGENLYASAEDLSHWDRALHEAAIGRRPLIATMLTRPALPSGEPIPYAFGLRQRRYRGLATITRSGHAPGISAETVRFPEHQLSVAVLCNAAHLYAGQRANRVADALLGDMMEPLRPLPPVAPAVTLSAAELQKYVGFYRAPDALDLVRIAIVDGKLVERLIDTVQTMTPRGNGQFTGDGSPGDFRLMFTPGSGGAMKLEFVSEGEVVGTLERLADSAVWRPDRTALAEYAGSYVSEELDVVWPLSVKDGTIVIRRPGTADAPFVPIAPDVFSRGFGSWNAAIPVRFEFHRDTSQRVTHFTVSTAPGEDSVRDLRFVRMNPR